MKLNLYLSTIEDRIKLRLLQDEARDLMRSIDSCAAGSEGQARLQKSLDAVQASSLACDYRITMHYKKAGQRLPMRLAASGWELFSAASAAAAALAAAFVLLYLIAPNNGAVA